MPQPTTAREEELMHHIRTLHDALADAPHSSVCMSNGVEIDAYASWYRQQRGPALEATDPDRWAPYTGGSR